MGVMSCSRKDCENIMCDTYINSVGYICDDCELEFRAYLQKKGLNLKTKDQVKKKIEKFLAVSKNTQLPRSSQATL